VANVAEFELLGGLKLLAKNRMKVCKIPCFDYTHALLKSFCGTGIRLEIRN